MKKENENPNKRNLEDLLMLLGDLWNIDPKVKLECIQSMYNNKK